VPPVLRAPTDGDNIKIDVKQDERFTASGGSGYRPAVSVDHSNSIKGKTVPQHTYGGAGGRMYSSYSFSISALGGGE
jgi:hypothetical protein